MAYEQAFNRLGEFGAAYDMSGSAAAQVAASSADAGDGYKKFGMLTLVASTTAGAQPLWRVTIATGPTVRTLGVIQSRPEAGEGTTLFVDGMVPVRAGAAIAAGADVMCDATGRAITYDGTVAANYRQGVALEAATAKDQVITILLRPQY